MAKGYIKSAAKIGVNPSGPIPAPAKRGAYTTADFAHQDFSEINSHAEPRTILDMASGKIPTDPEK